MAEEETEQPRRSRKSSRGAPEDRDRHDRGRRDDDDPRSASSSSSPGRKRAAARTRGKQQRHQKQQHRADRRASEERERRELRERAIGEAPPRGHVPPAGQVAAFRSLALSSATLRGLEEGSKRPYTTMTDIQNACIPHALAGRDVLGAVRRGMRASSFASSSTVRERSSHSSDFFLFLIS
jgi:hypothetical protein